jgi:hypothetical protein
MWHTVGMKCTTYLHQAVCIITANAEPAGWEIYALFRWEVGTRAVDISLGAGAAAWICSIC